MRRAERAAAALARHGIELKIPDGALRRTGYVAGSAKERADEFNRLAADPGIQGIIAGIGGLNSNGMLPFIDFDLFRERNLPVIGNSDVTAVLAALCSKGSMETYLGPALLSEWGEWPDVQPYDVASMLAALSGEAYQLPQSKSWTAARGDWTNEQQGTDRSRNQPTRWRRLVDGTGEGTLFGGNVETLNMLVGTPYWNPPERPLVCLEATDCEAHLPRFERALTHLVQAGLFDQAAGLALGRIPDARPVSQTTLDDVISRVLPGHVAPVVLDMDFGHSSPMATLPLGRNATLQSKDGAITFEIFSAETPARIFHH